MKPLVLGAVCGVLLAYVLMKLRVVTPSGAWAGAALVTAFFVYGGETMFGGFALLVILGTLASSFGKKEKRARGLAPPRDHQRNAWQALANGGPALALLLLLDQGAEVAALGALAGALADTAASEIGLLSKRSPRMLLVGPTVAPGRDGGMTWMGLGAGLIATLPHGIVAWSEPLGTLEPDAPAAWIGAVAVFFGGTVGQLVDSLLGSTIEPLLPKLCANDVVNFLASGAAGLATYLIWIELAA